MLPSEDIDLKVLPEKPAIDEANYGWTGRYDDYPCLLIGSRELDWDRFARTMFLDTRRWDRMRWSNPQERRLKRFLETAPEAGKCILVYVYDDIGTGVTVNGEHQAKRGGKKFTGLFSIVERSDGWFRAKLIKRD